MKKTLFFAAAACVALALSSCGGAASSIVANSLMNNMGAGAANGTTVATTTPNQGLLGGLISGLMSNLTPISTSSIKGTWTYESPECRFESENFLTQAGGMVMAEKIKTQMGSYLTKAGIKEGATTFVFDGKGTCTIMSGNNPVLNGTYTIDSNTRAINIKSQTGLISLSGSAYLTGNNLTLLFDAKKLMTYLKTAGTMFGGSNASTSAISSLLNYDGMKLGMNLKK